MKVASKVFIIIGLVYAIILTFLGTIMLLLELIGSSILFLIWGILSIIICTNALKKLKTAKNKEELKAISIIVLIFISLLGGIFMLNIKNEELNN